jgi:osmotically-inducible protein OsmY
VLKLNSNKNINTLKNNSELQTDILNAISWEPLFNVADIVVTANDGVVSLSGVVDTYAKKMEAELIAWKTKGICSVINNLAIDYYHELVV